MIEMFHRVDEIRASPADRIVGQGEITVVPSELVEAFGSPTNEPFDRESLGAFYFRGPGMEPFMLYFRAHDLGWWSMRRLKSTFWRDDTVREFKIATLRNGDVSEFKSWIAARLTAR